MVVKLPARRWFYNPRGVREQVDLLETVARSNSPWVMLPSPEPSDVFASWELELLRSARVARLGHLDDHDRPRVLPVTFAIACGRIWMAIDHKPKRSGREPARLRFIGRRPDVALTVDRYDDDWSRLAWVQVLGSSKIRGVADEPEALDALVAKYEPYREETPPGPLIAIEPERVLSWRA